MQALLATVTGCQNPDMPMRQNFFGGWKIGGDRAGNRATHRVRGAMPMPILRCEKTQEGESGRSLYVDKAECLKITASGVRYRSA